MQTLCSRACRYRSWVPSWSARNANVQNWRSMCVFVWGFVLVCVYIHLHMCVCVYTRTHIQVLLSHIHVYHTRTLLQFCTFTFLALQYGAQRWRRSDTDMFLNTHTYVFFSVWVWAREKQTCRIVEVMSVCLCVCIYIRACMRIILCYV